MIRSAIVLATASIMLAGPAASQGGGISGSTDDLAVEGLHHAAITVSDIDATVAFYSKAVPYKVIKRFRIRGSAFPRNLLSRKYKEIEIAWVQMPTGIIQLMDFEPGKPGASNLRPVIGPGYTHICFQSSSKDPAIKRFMAAGLSIISRFDKPDGVDIGGYGVRYAYGRDPDGIMIENETLDAPKRSEPAWITHIANTVHDLDVMLAFYSKLLGRGPHRIIEREGNAKLDAVANIDDLAIKGGWFNVGNMEIEVWEYVKPKTPLPASDRYLDEIGYNAIALEVDDLKGHQKRLKKLGIRLAGPAILLDGWKIQYGYDPEGNLFSLQQRTGRTPRRT